MNDKGVENTTKQAPAHGLERKMSKGAVAGMAANAVYLASRLALTPFILAYVSLAHFGLWSVCFIILSYAGLSAFGVNNAYIKYVAEHHAKDEQGKINSLLSTGLLVMGLLSAGIFFAIYAGAPFLLDQFDIAPDLRTLAGFLIVGASLAFLVDTWIGAFKSLLEGLQEIALVKTVWLVTSMLEVLLVVLFLLLGLGIKGVFYAYFIKTLLEVFTHAVLAFRRMPGLKISPFLFDKESLSALFVFGGKVQLLGFLGLFLSTFDRIVTTAVLGLEATGLFEVGRKLPFTARNITSAAFAPFLPAASALEGWWEESPLLSTRQKLHKYGGLCALSAVFSCATAIPLLLLEWSKGETALWSPYLAGVVLCLAVLYWPGRPLFRWFVEFMQGGERYESPKLKEIYLAGCRHINLINAVLYAFILAAGVELLLAWVGPGYENATPIMLLTALSSYIHMGTGAGTLIFRGVNRAGRELEYTLVCIVLAVIWTPALAWTHGLLGAVWGASISITLGSLYFIWRTNTAFRISFSEYSRRTLAPAFAPGCAGIVVFIAFKALSVNNRWFALGEVLFLGVCYLVLCGVLLKWTVLSAEEWGMLVRPLDKLGLLSGKKGGAA